MLKDCVNLAYGLSDEPFVGLSTKQHIDFCREFSCNISFTGNRFMTGTSNNLSPLLQNFKSKGTPSSPSIMLKRMTAEEGFIRLFIRQYEDDTDRIFQELMERNLKFGIGLKRITDLRFARASQASI